MRVLLIIPTHQYKDQYPAFLSLSGFPIGFAYLASALREAGHEVIGLNLNNDAGYQSAYEMIYDKIGRTLKEEQPALIGLGGICTDYSFIKDAMHIIRGFAPDIPIVCGGGIINNDSEYIFKLLKPDFCIIGEGEERIVQLANMIETGKNDYETIDNLGYWKNGNAVFTRTNFNYIDINERRFPDYEPFEINKMLDDYSMATEYHFRYIRPYPRVMGIVTARGCPFSCTFCVHDRNIKYRARSVDNIIQEISLLYERYNFNILIIVDELFAVNKLRLQEFCTALLNARETYKWDFNWRFQNHPNADLDEEVLGLAKKAGCYYFCYGLESASPRVLKSMNKKTKLSQIVNAITIADSLNIGFAGNFIFGDPAETGETISESIDFFTRYCTSRHTNMVNLRAYPGSKIFSDNIENGLIQDKRRFYETIDEDVLNMTSIPNRLYFPWINLMSLLHKYFLWTKSSDAIRFEEEVDTIDNPMTTHYEKSIWKVWVKCPHCGQEVFHREILHGLPSTKNAVNSRGRSYQLLKSLSQLSQRIMNIFSPGYTKRVWGLGTKSAFYYLFNFRNRFFKTTKIMLADRSGKPSFVTGCQNCNKRFRVNLPVDAYIPKSQIIKNKLLFKTIWLTLK